MTEIVKVEESHKADYMALFLLADPSEKMVAKYLGRGDVYVLFADGAPACVAVVTDYGPGTCELKNLATDEACKTAAMRGKCCGICLPSARTAMKRCMSARRCR